MSHVLTYFFPFCLPFCPQEMAVIISRNKIESQPLCQAKWQQKWLESLTKCRLPLCSKTLLSLSKNRLPECHCF